MHFKTNNVDGHELKYSTDWVGHLESAEHWFYYWNQAKLVRSTIDKEEKILEIGVGSGFLINYLKSIGYHTISLDIDADKKPDIVGEASSFNYNSLDISVVLAFEIFEHIPLFLFEKTISSFKEKNITKILFSVPYCQVSIISGNIKLPKMKKINFNLAIPSKKIKEVAHHWELTRKKNYSNKTIALPEGKNLVGEGQLAAIFDNYGFSINKFREVNHIKFFLASKR